MLFILEGRFNYGRNTLANFLPKDKTIIFSQNIEVISPNLFADLIGKMGEYRNMFEKIIELNEI